MKVGIGIGILATMLLTVVIVAPEALAYGGISRYTADGVVKSYYPNPNGLPPDPNPSAIVVGGYWDIKVKGEEVAFNLYYFEKNLISELESGAPVGSVDTFYISLIELNSVKILRDGKCVVTGKFLASKLRAQPDGSMLWQPGYYEIWGGTVTITPYKMTFAGDPWFLTGSTNK